MMGCFADDPAAFFSDKSLAVHHLSMKEQEALQLEALQQRFGEMRNALAPLKALADSARIEKIKRIEDVAPLLFPHSIYKAYPQALIETLRFPELTEWLSRLTLNDLTDVKGRHFGAIDHWMDALDGETDLAIVTSSGTTDALSLIPRGKREIEYVKKRKLTAWQEAPGRSSPNKRINVEHGVVWLGYAEGRSGIIRNGQLMRDMQAIAGRPFLPLITIPHSTDWQIYIGRAELAHKHNTAPPELTAYLQLKMQEANELHQHFDDRIRSLLQALRDRLHSMPVAMVGGQVLLHRVASEGLKMGMEPGLAPGSIVRSGGGLKGVEAPLDMERTIKRFTGVDAVSDAYAMSELLDGFRMCSAGAFHIWPWIIPLVLDAESGAILPRRGQQSGRAAFVDLSIQTYWGAVATADRVTMSWDRCSCGRTTPHVLPSIGRIAPPEHDEHVLGGAAPKAIHAALHALNDGLH